MSEEKKVCPFCGEDISIDDIKCPYCKEILNKEEAKPNTEILYQYNGLILVIDKIIKFLKSNLLKTIIKIIFIIAIIVCIIWVLGFDYPAAVLNQERFWYGQYITAGILHTLLAILFAIFLLILK